LDGTQLTESEMTTADRSKLREIRTLPSLVMFLRDELGWPIAPTDFEEIDPLVFEYDPEELGLDPRTATKIQTIQQLRPLTTNQPWGVFFVEFAPRRLPVVALRRILGRLVRKRRASAIDSDRASWDMDDLLFISSYGEGGNRQISLAHFAEDADEGGGPKLLVLGWDGRDTNLHLDHVVEELRSKLTWPEDESNTDAWREQWSSAFTLRHREVVTTSKALAVRLAELARGIRDRIETILAMEADNGPTTRLMETFRAALVHDLSEGDFADMYAQTIAYGLLTARIASPTSGFTPLTGSLVPVTNPFLKELMQTFLNLGEAAGQQRFGASVDFDELGVGEVTELLDQANMEAVVLDFGDRNPQEDPVIHFYELFLKEYDAQRRVQRGVFYTPRPVVSFIVNSVHQLLQTRFGLEDGLADTATWAEMLERCEGLEIPEGVSSDSPFVCVLDPATGTGTFLVEVIDLIHSTMTEKWLESGSSTQETEDLWNEYVPRHLLPRLCGFEILMAPYAIAHLKIGLKLRETGYRFRSDARVGVFLTNALEPAHDFTGQLAFVVPALAHEAEAVAEMKRQGVFTVVVGNPPYSHWSANLEEQHRQLVEPYKYVDGERIRERGALQFEINIQDDYVKFIRLAEMSIELSDCGVVGFITNSAFLDSATFRGMRAHLAGTYDAVSVLDLHGSVKASGAKARERGDENVFDIQQGVAITVAWREAKTDCRVHYSELWGSRSAKYQTLLAPHKQDEARSFRPTAPEYLFVYRDEALFEEYNSGVRIDEMFRVYSSGVKTNRDALTISFDDEELVSRMEIFLDPNLDEDEVAQELGVSDKKYWSIEEARGQIDSAEWLDSIGRVDYRPFDRRSIVYHHALVHSMRRPVMSHLGRDDNLAILLCRQQITPGFAHVFATRQMYDCCCVSNRSRENTSGFPVRTVTTAELLDTHLESNLIGSKVRVLEECLGSRTRPPTADDNLVCMLYAQLHSETYRNRYEEFLQRDYPRVFAPRESELFHTLADKGRELLALHLLESERLRNPTTACVGSGEFHVERVSYRDGTIWIDKARTRGFSGVPQDVWEYRIGSYQVCQKWLKDRQVKSGKNPSPGRVLTPYDMARFQMIVTALTMSLELMVEIDSAIEGYGGWPEAFTTPAKSDSSLDQ